MKALAPVFDLWRLAFYRWALREISPLHPDVPGIVLEIHRIQSKGVRT